MRHRSTQPQPFTDQEVGEHISEINTPLRAEAPATDKERPTDEQLAAIYRFVLRKMYGDATSVMNVETGKTIFAFEDVERWLRAEALALKEKGNEDSTMPALQRAAQDGVDTESRTRDDARHQRGEGALSEDAGVPEVALKLAAEALAPSIQKSEDEGDPRVSGVPAIGQGDLPRENRNELVSAIQTVLRGFEEGVFVRSIEHDAEPGWAIKLLPFIGALSVLQRHANEPK